MTVAVSSPVAVPAWRTALPLALGVFGALIAIFWPTFHSMIETWERSDTFAHGYVVFPISAWLIWRSRAEIACVVPQTDWRAVVVLALAGAGWLFAEAGSVNSAAQYALVTMLIASVWATLGLGVVRAILFPLAFLYMAVPAGEFLIPPMMEFTADFAVAALKLTGIPIYREGLHFSIPSGDWSVVEACSGVRYLIASITLGLLYAYLTYRSWRRRLLFTIAALLVPILANGGRAYLIVMIAHVSDNQLGVGADHVLYGWVFFGVVMLALFWIGTFWRQDDGPQLTAIPLNDVVPVAAGARVRVAVGVLAAALVWQGYAAWLDRRPAPVTGALQFTPPAGWVKVEPATDWKPGWRGADQQLRASLAESGATQSGATQSDATQSDATQSDAAVFVEINYYATQRQGAELINSQHTLLPGPEPVWARVGQKTFGVEIDGERRRVLQTRLRAASGKRLLVWQWNLIDGKVGVNPVEAKLVLALKRVLYRPDAAAAVLIATAYDDDPAPAAARLARFANSTSAAIAQTVERAAAP